MTTFDDPTPVYDDAYPYGEAGHAVDGPQIDSGGDFIPPKTTYGYDHGFSGDSLEHVGNDEPVTNVGYPHTNTEIDRRVTESSGADRLRVTQTADKDIYGNYTFGAIVPVMKIIRRTTRRSVTITNQGPTLMFIGNTIDVANSITGAIRPDCVYLPPGAARTLYTKADVFIAGVAGCVVDWYEELYNG